VESDLPVLPLHSPIHIGKDKYGPTVLWDSTIIFFLIPIVDRCVYPLLGAYIPTILQRIGIGALLYMSAPAILIAAIAAYRTIDNYYFVLIGAAVFVLSVGEVFFEIAGKPYHSTLGQCTRIGLLAGLEFSYAQSPRDMNGFMIGMYYFFASLSSILPAIILSLLIKFNIGIFDKSIWYNAILLLIAVPGYLFFLWVAVHYKRR